MFERYVAVDNVCAWPNLTKMPDGAIIALFSTSLVTASGRGTSSAGRARTAAGSGICAVRPPHTNLAPIA